MWANLISDLRKEKGLSERELADLSHVNRGSLRRFLSGKSQFRIDQLENVLGVLGYEVDAVIVDGGK